MAALSWRSWVVHTSELCLVVVFGIPWPGVKKCYGMLWVTLKEYYWVWARLTESTYGFCFDFLMDFGGFLMHEPSHFAARCSPAWSSWMVQHSGDPVEKVLPPSVTRAVQLPKHLGLSEHWKTTILIVYPLVMTNSLPWYCIDGPNRNRFGKHSVLKNGWIFAMLNNHLFMTCYHPSRPLIHMCWFGQSQSHMTICSVYDVKFRCSRYFPYVTFSPFSGYSYMNNELWSLFHAAFGHLQRA